MADATSTALDDAARELKRAKDLLELAKQMEKDIGCVRAPERYFGITDRKNEVAPQADVDAVQSSQEDFAKIMNGRRRAKFKKDK